jgi:hypothetical protein
MRTGTLRHRATARRAKAILMIVASLSVLAFMAAGAYLSRTPALDATTLCPTDLALTTSVVMLVDTTDQLNATQAARFLATVRRTREEIPTFGKLTIIFLDANAPYEPKELVSSCNPGSLRQINPLFQTESRAAKRWTESFGSPIDKAVSQLLSAPTAKRSPIIEAITAATWRPDFDIRTPNRRLIVVSDLLQHDPDGYTHYANPDLWRSFQKSKLFKEADANLHGVDVEIEYLRRPSAGTAQGEAHRAFWRRWLTNRGARTVQFVGIANMNDRGSAIGVREVR